MRGSSCGLCGRPWRPLRIRRCPMRRWLLSLLLCLWIPARVAAKDLLLAWEWEGHDAETWPLTVVDITTQGPQQRQLTLTPLPEAACQALAGKSYQAGHTFC